MNEKVALVTEANGGLGTRLTKALLDAGFTVVGLSARIQQSAFDHPNFIALPAALTNLDAGNDVTGAADPSLRGWSVANRVTLS
jgi:NAD(P)-dependent dehydrogenase (short-subunit alcohol dehydrogenase family)